VARTKAAPLQTFAPDYNLSALRAFALAHSPVRRVAVRPIRRDTKPFTNSTDL
jgi:hypothetical protein